MPQKRVTSTRFLIFFIIAHIVLSVKCLFHIFKKSAISFLRTKNAYRYSAAPFINTIARQLNKYIKCLGAGLCVTTTGTFIFNSTPHSTLHTQHSAVLLLFWIAIINQRPLSVPMGAESGLAREYIHLFSEVHESGFQTGKTAIRIGEILRTAGIAVGHGHGIAGH